MADFLEIERCSDRHPQQFVKTRSQSAISFREVVGILMMRGNVLGFIMFGAVAPIILIGSFVLKLADPFTMSCVGCALVIMDLLFRWRSRPSVGWLTKNDFGGMLFFIPVWIFGTVVIAANIAKALLK